MSVANQDITIIGAGVAGLALGRALALKGANVTILEQADAIREVGAGLQISPNGAAVLHALGLSDALRSVGTRAKAVELIDGLTGERVLRLDLLRLRPKHDYFFVHRADLISQLADGARQAGVQIRLLQRIETVDLQGARPHIVTGQGAEFAPDLLVGADGLHSKTGAAINGQATPFFTRQVAWRAVIPAAPGANPVAEVHMGEGRHLVSYPLRNGQLRNIVAVEERDRWVEESWTLRDDPMDLRLAFKRFSPRVRGWLDQIEDVWLWGLFRHPVARNWYHAMPEGAAVILGDAAHPTLPFLAQGASMGLEDAWVLADCLSRLPRNEAVAAFQAARAARCFRIVEAASGNAKAYHLSGVRRGFAHAGLRVIDKIAPSLALGRFDWLYGHDVTSG